MGNQNEATNVYAVSYHLENMLDSSRAGTTENTWAASFTLKFIYFCSLNGGVTISSPHFSNGALVFTEFFNPDDTSPFVRPWTTT